MSNQEKEIIISIVKALKEIYYAITSGVHGYNFTTRVRDAIHDVEIELEKQQGD